MAVGQGTIQSGRYTVAVWHGAGEVGRYVFVIGDKEQLGGDPAFPMKMRSYWTPVPQPAPTPIPTPAAKGHTCGHR